MVSMKNMSLLTAAAGVASFLFGVIGENKKLAAGTPIKVREVAICKYPKNPYVLLGVLSAVFLLITAIVGYYSLFKSYKGKSVPRSALFKSTAFSVFFNIAIAVTVLAFVMLVWPTATEQLHYSKNIHHNLQTDCPTAKTGLLGGGAFLALDAMLFWLVALMLDDNARKDYLDDGSELVEDGEDYDAAVAVKGSV